MDSDFTLRHERETLLKVKDAIAAEPKRFSMTAACLPSSCGTIACIGGWAFQIENPKMSSGEVRRIVIQHCYDGMRYNDLFYPIDDRNEIRVCSVKEAQQAIDNFLEDPESDPWAFLELEV